ncbi:MAG: arabinan endo-1,5-alpha-L-arabinosidase [Armatimonadaceae bacterium]
MKRENAVKHVHDPCLIRHQDHYFLFSTGHGIPIRRSHDLKEWEMLGRVFEEDVPAWAKEEIPGTVFPWAPDIAFFNGKYHLYYSVSTFGKNRSLIGLATNPTLNPMEKHYKWTNEGKVFESFPTSDFNAIDSHVFAYARGKMIFTVGSFWTGIKAVELDPKTGKPVPGAPVKSLAQRERPGAIEAPFLTKKGQFYYLFLSFDTCCQGVRSTYNIRVGRSKDIWGPYTDRDGKELRQGGGTPVLATEGSRIGPGHCAVLEERGKHLPVCHYYDATDKGVSTLMIRPLEWDNEMWPQPGPLLL